MKDVIMKGEIMNENYGTSYLYICHVHRDTSLLCMLIRTRNFDIYIRHDIMPTFSFCEVSSGIVTDQVKLRYIYCLVGPCAHSTTHPVQVKLRVRIRARLMSPCAHTWTVCG